MTSDQRKRKIVSLFSGAGGLDLGFRDANFDVVFALDSSGAAIETHKANFPGTESVHADLSELGVVGLLEKVDEVLDEGEAIGVIGGPPCQGFSRANPSRRSDDPRNRLPMLYLESVERLQSKYKVEFVLFENVLGLLDAKNEKTLAEIKSKLTSLGLHHHLESYCATEFGVPQRRKRVIVAAFSSPEAREAFCQPKTSDDRPTVRDTIKDLPSPAYFERNLDPESIPAHPNHWTMRPKSKRFTTDERSWSDTRSFRKLEWDEPSPTVAYGHREIHVHPEGHRRLSIYEAMLLQGFPTTFVLKGSLSEQVDQVSNAVPPPMAKAIAEATTHALDAGAPAS